MEIPQQLNSLSLFLRNFSHFLNTRLTYWKTSFVSPVHIRMYGISCSAFSTFLRHSNISTCLRLTSRICNSYRRLIFLLMAIHSVFLQLTVIQLFHAFFYNPVQAVLQFSIRLSHQHSDSLHRLNNKLNFHRYLLTYVFIYLFVAVFLRTINFFSLLFN